MALVCAASYIRRNVAIAAVGRQVLRDQCDVQADRHRHSPRRAGSVKQAGVPHVVKLSGLGVNRASRKEDGECQDEDYCSQSMLPFAKRRNGQLARPE